MRKRGGWVYKVKTGQRLSIEATTENPSTCADGGCFLARCFYGMGKILEDHVMNFSYVCRGGLQEEGRVEDQGRQLWLE